MKGLSGVREGPLPELAPLLKKWIYVNTEYVKRCVGRDAPWWFNERAALSAVAGAAWLADGIALEEYTAPKIPPGAAPGKLSDRCRCDLFISLKKRRRRGQHHDFITEAKIIWPRLDDSKLPHRIDQGINAVRTDIRRTMNDGYSRRLGLLLVSPWMTNAAADNFEGHAARFIEVLKHLDNVAVAWTFARDPWRLLWRQKGEYYPGTALVITPLRNQ
jgi:hypothetical protein